MPDHSACLRSQRPLALALLTSLLAHAGLGLLVGPSLRTLGAQQGQSGEQSSAPAHQVAFRQPQPARETAGEKASSTESRETPRLAQPERPPKRTLSAPQAKRSEPQPTETPEKEAPEPSPQAQASASGPQKEQKNPTPDRQQPSPDSPTEPKPDPAPSPPQRDAKASRQNTTGKAQSPPPSIPDAGEFGSSRSRKARPAAGADNPRPGYPMAARRMGAEGRVVLEVTVAADGSAKSVRVAQSSGHSILDRTARNTVRQWEFQPARAGGRAIEATITVPVRFELR